jgi:hypothetical protein
MYIVNQHGVVHSIPDDWKLPAGARKATAAEVAAYEAGPVVAPVVQVATPTPPVAYPMPPLEARHESEANYEVTHAASGGYYTPPTHVSPEPPVHASTQPSKPKGKYDKPSV